jgi:hypothetical protein
MLCGYLDGLVEVGTLEQIKAVDPFPVSANGPSVTSTFPSCSTAASFNP